MDTIETLIGIHEWQTVTVNDSNFCVPDLNWCSKFLMLILVVFWFIKGIFRVTSLVSR